MEMLIETQRQREALAEVRERIETLAEKIKQQKENE